MTASDDSLDEEWDISGTVQFIKKRECQVVTLQFPDELLRHAASILRRLQACCVIEGLPAQVMNDLDANLCFTKDKFICYACEVKAKYPNGTNCMSQHFEHFMILPSRANSILLPVGIPPCGHFIQQLGSR